MRALCVRLHVGPTACLVLLNCSCRPLPVLQWHPRINQIFVGCGGRSGGCVRTFYDPKLSSKGAVLAASRAPRTTTTDFMQASGL